MLLLTGADGVRSTAKGILLCGGKVLLNRCRDSYNGDEDYYALPGGGQEKYESIEETLKREMLEETGYRVGGIRFAGLYEEICDDLEYRRDYPQYSHKMYHFFLCKPEGEQAACPQEMDGDQICSEWIAIKALPSLRILPGPLGAHIMEMIEGKTVYLGTGRTPEPHG